ncbi:MAG TPA: hypothetical protein VNS81_03590 [Nocardioides sp.]|nr:hypothetical protein [Nocardioides sp.]
MSQEPQPRPAQATMAAALIIGGSVFVVLMAWQRIASLHTIKVQEELAKAFGSQPFTDLPLSLDDWSTVVRVLCMVAAGSATAATILGLQVFKRSPSARVALTVLAPLILISGVSTAGFFAPMVVAGITMLWLQPTRDWYAGRPWMELFQQRREAALARAAQQVASRQTSVQQRSAPEQWGVLGPVPGPAGLPGTAPVLPPPAPPRPRPSALVWACVLTWVGSGLALVGLLMMGVAAAGEREELMDQLREQEGQMLDASGLTEHQVLLSLYVMLVGLALWAVAAIVLAVLAYAGRDWARITLAVSAACCGVLLLVMAIATPTLVVAVAGVAVTMWLLLRSDVAAWFRR